MCFAANLKKNLFTPWQLCYHLNVTMETRGPDNKLQSYFLKMVRESFWQLGIYDATVAGYVADVLAEFARVMRFTNFAAAPVAKRIAWSKCWRANRPLERPKATFSKNDLCASTSAITLCS